MDFYDMIYDSLIGQLTADAALPWVPDAFADGTPCEAAYARLIAARNRVLLRLGQEEDEDLSRMLQEMELIQRTLCREIMALRHL